MRERVRKCLKVSKKERENVKSGIIREERERVQNRKKMPNYLIEIEDEKEQ